MSNRALQIAILGDSSSTGIGDGQDVYPYQVFQALQQDGAVRMENWASPGISSADASKLYLQQIASRDLDVLVIYLGNNEGSRSRYKGTYRPLRNHLRESFRRFLLPTESHLDPEKIPYVFAREPAPSSIATTPSDFFRNLSTIIRRALRDGTEVLLINPEANRGFPAGLGARNFSFYRYVNIADKISDALVAVDSTSELLVKGIRCHTQGNVMEAARCYECIQPGAPYCYQIARNNLAVSQHETGQNVEAEKTLSEILASDVYDRAILLYNLGLITGSTLTLQEAYETDISLYRVKDAYRTQISTLTTEFPIHLLDLATFVKDDHFVDYCHLTSAGHRILAEQICSTILGCLGNLEQSYEESNYRNHFPNPNYFFDSRKDLAGYYMVSPGFTEADILNTTIQVCTAEANKKTTSIENNKHSNSDALVTAIRRATRNALRHPVVTEHADLIRYPIRFPYEIGSFPEFYIYRLLGAYGAALNASGHHKHWQDWRGRLPLREPHEYEHLILSQQSITIEQDSLDLTPERRNRILTRVEKQLGQPGFYSDRSGERRKTIIYWYTRESFRFGTQSRVSMLYDRVALEQLAEGVSVAWIIDRLGTHALATDRIEHCRLKIQQLLDVHDQFSTQLISKNHTSVSKEYVAVLERLRQEFSSDLPDLCGL